MKASEMTNEELAACIASARLAPAKYVREDDLNFHSEAIREAAARLRNQGNIIKMVHVQTRIAAKLYRRLKVSEDALRKLQERLVASVHDGTMGHHEALKIAEDAITTIRDEGGAK